MMLSGYKTYIVGGAMIVYGLALIVTGDVEQGVARLMEGLGLVTLRSGISKGSGG